MYLSNRVNQTNYVTLRLSSGPCADPGIFVRGVQVNLTKKLWQRVLVHSLFYWSQMVNFEEDYHSSRLQRHAEGVHLFPGGGVQLLIPYRNPYNLWFSRGVPDPLPPPPPHTHTSGSAIVVTCWERADLVMSKKKQKKLQLLSFQNVFVMKSIQEHLRQLLQKVPTS